MPRLAQDEVVDGLGAGPRTGWRGLFDLTTGPRSHRARQIGSEYEAAYEEVSCDRRVFAPPRLPSDVGEVTCGTLTVPEDRAIRLATRWFFPLRSWPAWTRRLSRWSSSKAVQARPASAKNGSRNLVEVPGGGDMVVFDQRGVRVCRDHHWTARRSTRHCWSRSNLQMIPSTSMPSTRTHSSPAPNGFVRRGSTSTSTTPQPPWLTLSTCEKRSASIHGMSSASPTVRPSPRGTPG